MQEEKLKYNIGSKTNVAGFDLVVAGVVVVVWRCAGRCADLQTSTGHPQFTFYTNYDAKIAGNTK